ncbi:calponin family repeat domain-containing protein [Ditylenchus destructor]|uniref:Calponin family repeat domain-containing protein n=1 Tax=Ditylenchus destructor TaxID=166010 RepID=A0AAD4MQU2_9BILA|nr:calponin family repeat domain-containing protein [Ditylenchus destructor]
MHKGKAIPNFFGFKPVSKAQSKNAPVPFPHWVVKMAHNQPRQFPKEVIRQGAAVIPLQYGTNKCASQKGMTPYGLARQITSESVAAVPHGSATIHLK